MTRLLVVLFFVAGCAAHAPPSLSPAGVLVWQANEAVVILGTTQHVAIALNGVAGPDGPLLSDRNTGIVVDAVTDALVTISAVPAGWRATGLAALDRIALRLDAAGQTKLAGYLRAARTGLEVLP